MDKPITAVSIAVGDRGTIYGQFALKFPQKLKIIAVAEPNETRRENYARIHKISSNHCFSDWKELLNSKQIAKIAIIATPDQVHFEPAIKAMKLGYDVLLEKPMAVTVEDCIELVNTSKETGKILQICHVLRHTKFFRKIHEIIRSGRIGKIVNISLRENVSYFHYAHSFIRGNWNNRLKSSPMILSKCSHDFDILYWLINANPLKISSFGSLSHFGKENAPKGTPKRCSFDCPVASTCLYFAYRIYLDIIPLLHVSKRGGNLSEKVKSKLILKFPSIRKLPLFKQIDNYSGWPVSVITEDFSRKGKIKALNNGPYGRCVYFVDDHDVVDHQTVNFEFENGITATLTMQGYSHEEGRTIRIDGNKGTIIGEFLLSKQEIVVYDSLSDYREVVLKFKMSDGHGGGDEKLMDAFINSVMDNKTPNNRESITTAQVSLMSHLMAFASDEARLKDLIINPNDYLSQTNF